jgi:hypothetical protein
VSNAMNGLAEAALPPAYWPGQTEALSLNTAVSELELLGLESRSPMNLSGDAIVRLGFDDARRAVPGLAGKTALLLPDVITRGWDELDRFDALGTTAEIETGRGYLAEEYTRRLITRPVLQRRGGLEPGKDDLGHTVQGHRKRRPLTRRHG